MNPWLQKHLDVWSDPEFQQEFGPTLAGISERRFTIKEADCSSRNLSYWADEKLLFEDVRENKWRKFDLEGLAWLKMIQQMRSFGLSCKVIEKVKNNLKPAGWQTSMVQSPIIQEILQALAKKENLNPEEFSAFVMRPEFLQTFSRAFPSHLKALILLALIRKDHLALLVDPEGDILPYMEAWRSEMLESPESRSFLLGTHLVISVTEILVEFFGYHEPEYLHDLQVITADEMEVLKAIRLPNVRSVTVRLTSGGVLDLLEIAREQKVDRSMKLNEVLLKGGYQEITLKTQQGRIYFCENSTRIKFDKLTVLDSPDLSTNQALLPDSPEKAP